MKKNLRVLFVSGEMIGADLAYQLKKEGCQVKLYIEDESRKDCFDGIVEKTDDWRKELDWVGKDGLIVFDDVGYGKAQDDLRKSGYNVVGGSAIGDKLEKDRNYGQKIFSACGMKIVSAIDFNTAADAISFVKKNKGAWVIKQNGHLGALNYIGQTDSGEDVIGVLEGYKQKNISNISLQKKIYGVEIGIARYFNGLDWVGPIEFNIEHKSLFNGDIGPQTGEMGTVMWYDENEKNKLFQETLAKLKNFLAKANFKGDIDINCIVNNDGAFPLEATTRLGCPSTQLQSEIHLSPWHEFLMAIAKGGQYNLKYKKGYGIIVSVSIPPFPYKSISNEYYSSGAPILFKEELSEKELNKIHFEEVSAKNSNNKTQYFVAGNNGYVVYVSGLAKNILEARRRVYAIIDKLIIPKMFYRTDIGVRFMKKDLGLLRKWGWIRSSYWNMF